MSYLCDKSSWFEFRLPSYRDVDKSNIGTVYVEFCIDMNRETEKTECTVRKSKMRISIFNVNGNRRNTGI